MHDLHKLKIELFQVKKTFNYFSEDFGCCEIKTFLQTD